MQEEKVHTTTPQENGGKHHRRKKNNRQQRNTVPEKETETMTQAEKDPTRSDEATAEAAVPQIDKKTDNAPQTPTAGEKAEEPHAEAAAEEPLQAQEPEAPETAQPAEEAASPEAADDAEKPAEPQADDAMHTPEPAETNQNAPQPENAAAAQTTEPAADTPQPAEETTEDTQPPEDKSEQETTDREAPTAPQEEPEAVKSVEEADEQEKSAESKPPEKSAAGEAPAKQEEKEEQEELPEEDEKRLSDMTRTVQLSVEQIMARVSEEENAADESTPPDVIPEEDEGPVTLRDHMRYGLSGMAKWMLLVLFFVLVIAGFGVAWLYRSATPDMLPQITVTFAGQAVEPMAYKWKVPVVGNIFKRTYEDTLNSTPVTLPESIEQVSPDFTVSPSGYRTELTVTDSQDTVLFEGDIDSFSAYQFTANGTYTAKLVVHSDASSVPGDATVTGTETWQFTFTVGVRPSVRLSSTAVNQGSVVAVRVGDTLDGQPPQIKTNLTNTGFYAASTGWVCYLPIPWNEPAGTQTIEVTAGGYTETMDLKISTADWAYKDYSSNSQRVSPYIGENDIPAELKKLLQTSEQTVAWSDGGFVQPFLNTLDVKLTFGTTEYAGRSYSERNTNNGAGGRTLTNLVLNTTAGELLIAPASGKVLLAKDLGGDFGYTLVIDHGAGVKSIFYNLQGISVKAGAAVKQGQTLATCSKTTVAEMRIGTVPIDPLQVWRGQCDALKYY